MDTVMARKRFRDGNLRGIERADAGTASGSPGKRGGQRERRGGSGAAASPGGGRKQGVPCGT
jgi:hypothetical protein